MEEDIYFNICIHIIYKCFFTCCSLGLDSSKSRSEHFQLKRYTHAEDPMCCVLCVCVCVYVRVFACVLEGVFVTVCFDLKNTLIVLTYTWLGPTSGMRCLSDESTANRSPFAFWKWYFQSERCEACPPRSHTESLTFLYTISSKLLTIVGLVRLCSFVCSRYSHVVCCMWSIRAGRVNVFVCACPAIGHTRACRLTCTCTLSHLHSTVL